MPATVEQSEPAQHFVFHGVSWSYYEQTLAAIGNRRIPVAYLDGAMEIGYATQAEPAQHFVFYDVPWAFYEQTLAEFGNQAIRITYLDGAMELMSPLPEHEEVKKALGNLVTSLAVERDIPMKCFGSTTFRRERKVAGSEPDECFYFNEIDSVIGMERFDPLIHRPPDLWVEVDILNPSLPREPIYARLGVPEVWRYRDGRIAVRLLGPSCTFIDSAASKAFPYLPLSQFASFVPKMLRGNDTRVLREFRQWAQNLPQ